MRQAGWLVVITLSVAGGCAGYVQYTGDSSDNKQAVAPAAELVPPFHQPHEPLHPSLFSLLIDWLADHGGLGQLLANLMVAVFVLPPVGPYFCGLVHNCDTARATGRQLILSAFDAIDARSTKSLEVTKVLELLDSAYDKYA